jgi:acetolactate synthase-1/2/3 large subunit
LEALLPLLKTRQRLAWREAVRQWQALEARPANNASVLRPHQIMQTIGELAGKSAIYVTDVGQHQLWAAQYARHLQPRSFITSGGLGAMGFGYGAAIGASFAAAGRPVVHITGDGSFHMNLNEACTAVSYRAPVITVIFDNQGLGMVRQWQNALCGGRHCATEPRRATDYCKLAEGFGLPAFRCETLAEFALAFGQALQAGGPVWIVCKIDPAEAVLPMLLDETYDEGKEGVP